MTFVAYFKSNQQTHFSANRVCIWRVVACLLKHYLWGAQRAFPPPPLGAPAPSLVLIPSLMCARVASLRTLCRHSCREILGSLILYFTLLLLLPSPFSRQTPKGGVRYRGTRKSCWQRWSQERKCWVVSAADIHGTQKLSQQSTLTVGALYKLRESL